MTYKEIEGYKAKEMKRIKRVVYLLLCIVVLIIFTNSLIFGALLGIVILMPALSVTVNPSYMDKRHKALENKYNWDDEEIVLSINGTNLKPFNTMILGILYAILYFCIIYILKDFLSIGLFVSLLIISAAGIGIILKSVFNLLQNTILITAAGIVVHKIQYSYQEMKRYQFIKLKKGGYIFEVNTGKTYFKVFVKEDEKQLIEKMLNK